MCLVAQLRLTLCDSMGCSPPASFAHGDFQARILQWVSMLSSKGSSQPRDWAQVFHIEDRFFTIWGIREALILRSNDSLQPHGLSHTRLPCPSLSPRVCSKSCPLSQWCYPTISFSVIPFSSCFQSFPASGSFPMGQFFTSGGQSIGASVPPMNIQDWFPLGLTGLISLQSKRLSRVIYQAYRK